MSETVSQRKLIRPGSGEGRREGSRAVRRKQTPPEQTSPTVQKAPSSQADPVGEASAPGTQVLD